MTAGKFVAFVAAAAVCSAGLPSATGDGAPRRRRPPATAVEDLRIGDGGLVVTTDASPDVEVRFRLASRKRKFVRLRFERGVDVDGDGHVSEAEFAPLTLEPSAGSRTRPLRRRDASRVRYEAGPEGVEHVVVWRIRDRFSSSRMLAAMPIPRDERPDAFDLEPRTRPVVRVTPRPGEAATQAFEYDGDAAPVAAFESVSIGELAARIFVNVADADSEDLNGDGKLDPLDGEDRNGDGVLQSAPQVVRAWFVRVPPDFDPRPMDEDDLLRLDWSPCTWYVEPNPPQLLHWATPSGRTLELPWAYDADVPGEVGPFLVGVRVHDQQLSPGGFVVSPAPVTIPR